MSCSKFLVAMLVIIFCACQPERKSPPSEMVDEPTVEDILREDPENSVGESEALESTSDLTMDEIALIDPYQINEALLIRLIEEGVNLKRVEKGQMILRPNLILQNAARHQNNYQVRLGQLSHTQNNSDMRQVQNRVAHFGGTFRTVGENVQFQGFQVMFRNGQQSLVRPAYRDAAEEIVQNWINSPGHYRNLVNDKFDQVGTAIAWSAGKNAIFATQVFGG